METMAKMKSRYGLMKSNEWLSVEEWFDEYYPKEWGDWRKEYNAGKFRETRGTACTYRDYYGTGARLGATTIDGIIHVIDHDGYKAKHHIFVDATEADYISPCVQPKDGREFASVIVNEYEAISTIQVTGCDDVTFTKEYENYYELMTDFEAIRRLGVGRNGFYLPDNGFKID
jgi:hypothetical protein